MNVGGPAHHVSLLSGQLDPRRYETLLVCGRVGPGEASYEALAERHGARLQRLPALSPEIAPERDASALRQLREVIRKFQPDIVHTHTAKAGFLGRIAAALERPRPVIVHTYHGHVLEGYFGPTKTALYRSLERTLAHVSDRLVGVSGATIDDLVRLRVAPRKQFVQIPLGLALDPFLHATRSDGAQVRADLGLCANDLLVTCVGRLVPIKRIDLALRALAEARAGGYSMVLALVGDGGERQRLETLTRQLEITDAVHFLGFRSDTAAIAAATDIALLTSDNEGTPVALIEASAAARPAVATRVGGVGEVVKLDTGLLVAPGNVAAIAGALGRLSDLGPEGRAKLGESARAHVRERYSARRLVVDIDELYGRLLAEKNDGCQSGKMRGWPVEAT
jgi:glycosyltransferase involved in cell wall biosynthesis